MGNLWSSGSLIPALGKVVLITGCSDGGIGHALALEFRKRGATVYASSRRVETMTGLEEQGIHVIALDVTSQDSIQDAVTHIKEAEGRVEILVNNAGMSISGPFAETPLDVWHKFYDANVFGVVALSQAVFPIMAAQRCGRILNVGSVAAYCHRPWSAVYSSTKAAVHTMTDCMRMEMKPFGVDVILVAPGYIMTKIFCKAVDNSITLPPGSLYSDYEAVYKHNYEIKTRDAKNTPVDKFAKDVVDGALRRKAPWRLLLGASSTLAVFAAYLPTWLADYVLWSGFTERTRRKLKDA